MRIVTVILQGLLGLAFLGAGGSKLAGTQMHKDNFKKWRYPDRFRLVTGAVEVLGAIGMIVGIWRPVVGAVSGLWLGATMLGAVYTHVVRVKDRGWPAPGVLLVLSLAVTVLRWSALRTWLREGGAPLKPSVKQRAADTAQTA